VRDEIANLDEAARSNTLSRAMRVLVVTHMWPTDDRPEHGVFVRDQVEALGKVDGLEVEVRRFPPGSRSYVSAAWRLRGAARRGRFDVVHAHYGLSGLSALTAGGLQIVTYHGTDLEHRIAGPLSRLLARLVTLPAVVSLSLARRVPGAGSRRRVAVLPCGVSLERFARIARERARAQLGLDVKLPYVLFPADPARPVKRYDRARELCEQVPGAELLSLRGVPPERVPLWINAANAVLVTSDHEGFGLVALEALACDVPVLSTPVGIAPLALAGVEGTLCAPFDLAEWLPVLRAHLNSPDPRVHGRARAELFSSARMADRVAATYRELTGTTRSG
jgi:teichuronic acid biosynthesis glycosyltransferase TuaC